MSVRLPLLLVAALGCGLLMRASQTASGQDLFQRRCGGCHALDSTRVGPALRRIFGRTAASDPSFPYSDALRRSHVVWDARSLDRWLADPEAVAPENDMAFRMPNAAERAAIVEYLRQVGSKPAQP